MDIHLEPNETRPLLQALQGYLQEFEMGEPGDSQYPPIVIVRKLIVELEKED